ncbi:VanZ family protein [Ilumatobacter coccineus]|uniref:VanZ-like domain-containing protein n=1 Tax=Ilumatobacter coccineus (strain NBRC 103263 / KCTC 29153 / YM16-304) TaxID=1313172 RepID=A0A6C7DZ58_ILUCY|nr:VanZ family protein [Ilumatobacter coccineus]BAN01444.1 hypothetical protein YM304_11300 [Ilumatobacter coccineus YM16-304]
MHIVGAAGVNRDVSSIAATEAWPALLALVAVSGLVAFFATRRWPGRSAFEWFVAFSTGALIVAVTLLRGEVSPRFDVGRLADWSSGGVASISRDPLSSSQFVLNVALFVPAGAAWTWITRRPGRTVAALVATSFLIECVQAVTGIGANDAVDLVSNILGALIGTGAAFAISSLVSGERRELSTRDRLRLLGGLSVAVVVIGLLWFGGASRRQAHVRSVVEERFAGTDLVTIQTMIEADFESVFSAVDGARADGFSSENRVELRFPATFFGLHRCVYATWTAGSMDVRNASGNECTRLLG